MATTAEPQRPARAGENRFFVVMASIMALINVAAFSFFKLMGISSFGAPLYVHVHAVFFFGWVFLFLIQVALGANGAAGGSLVLHRRLGWLALGWALAMIAIGTFTTVRTVQLAHVPFFFLPAEFLVMNPFSAFLFAALVGLGIVRRRDRAWHPRLMICAMAVIMGPAFGRALPAPLLMYHMFPAIAGAMLLIPLAGMLRDRLRLGRVHPAWFIGFAAVASIYLLSITLGRSPLAVAIYDATVAGTPGAAQPALVYPASPFAAAP